ncbi:NAD(P)-binding protein [Dictyobacter aurantiacus]|uniref:FAD/NAD(P)-binding domain-containing protein n=1 Tax=Dictyobacter aurantiacus TaxID=1936993 RepID=A0A401ZQQ6_9CHLR|nr:NAD(P)-binding protein [Dictyobacter aurantiacus]GCE09213.1 hypothetical protein KDAU_65420 [Dictyobacter aurantiacus]
MNENIPAVAILKHDHAHIGPLFEHLLAQMLADKGISTATMRFLAHQQPHFLGALFGHVILRSPAIQAQGQLLRQSFTHLPAPPPEYQGTRRENIQVDASWEGQSQACGWRSVTWRGAAGAYSCAGLRVPAQVGLTTRIVIIGAGAAGLLAARALLDVGFVNVVLFDQSGQCGGVWNQDFLRGASRANPFPLRFEDYQLDAAPGTGHAVMEWLHSIARGRSDRPPTMIKARVLTVQPGDVEHRICYEDEAGRHHEMMAPIVINALGVGEPLSPSRPGVMTTDVAPHEAGIRWQQVWTAEHARRYHGRTVLFISLSNSTLEMVKQIQHFNRAGLNIDYRILTHYPDAALAEPGRVVMHHGHKMRLYRSPEKMQLLRLAGDLPEVAAAFEQARDTGHIVSHVMHWSLEHGEQRRVVAIREDGVVQRFPYDELYTLIGYAPNADLLREMGLSVNHPYLGAVDLDYDSEVQRAPEVAGRARLYPGYFCLGIRNAFNMNEVLLPGLLFRLPDVVAGVILRSIEYFLRGQQH